MSELIAKAQLFCISKHAFQKRKYTGEPYWIHPFRVAGMVMEVTNKYSSTAHLDDYLICAALLHDTIEDTGTKREEIEQLFGKEIASEVEGLTNVSKLIAPNANRATRKKMDEERLAKEGGNVRLIKYCDRYDNLYDTFNYVTNWNIKQKLPEAGFFYFYKYINESRDLLGVLNIQELAEIFGNSIFDKYNLNMLIDNLQNELDLVTNVKLS